MNYLFFNIFVLQALQSWVLQIASVLTAVGQRRLLQTSLLCFSKTILHLFLSKPEVAATETQTVHRNKSFVHALHASSLNPQNRSTVHFLYMKYVTVHFSKVLLAAEIIQRITW